MILTVLILVNHFFFLSVSEQSKKTILLKEKVQITLNFFFFF